MCDQLLPLPTWNQHKISPTYLSTNLVTPLQIPFRDTVPRSHIIAEGTCRRFPRLEWGSFIVDYGGIGKLPFLGKTRKHYRELLLPRSHRHYLSSCGKMIHGVVQPSKITCLLKSKLRHNDEFIVQPCRCKERDMMKEDNHFIQEPCYSSHRSRNDMFPKSRADHDSFAPTRSHDFRLKTPLNDITRQELEGVVRRRYRTSSYTNDFQQPEPGAHSSMEKTGVKLQRPKQVHNQLTHDLQHKVEEEQLRVTGLWPCWPAGNNYIVSNVTGQIVEKRDVNSLDDLRDYRTWKMGTFSSPKSKDEGSEEKAKTFRSFAGPDYVFLPCVDIYGCGPGEVGGGNLDKEIPAGVDCSINAGPDKSICRRCNRANPSAHKPENEANLMRCKDCVDIEPSMRLRWVKDTKLARLKERISEQKSLLVDKRNEIQVDINNGESDEQSAAKSEIDDLTKERVVASNKKMHDTFCEDVEVNEDNSIETDELVSDFTPPLFCTATDINVGCNSPTDDGSVVSLELRRDTETVSRLLASINQAESAKQRKIDQVAPCPPKLEEDALDPTKDPTSVYFRPPIKLPPNPLWTTLPYDGDRIPDRLGVRFKTVALKRYHAMHPETIPDLRDFRPPLRRSKFLGYHTSVFR